MNKNTWLRPKVRPPVYIEGDQNYFSKSFDIAGTSQKDTPLIVPS